MTGDTGGVSTSTAQPPSASARPAPKRKRGLESVGDMVRSLGIVLVIVVVVWFFAQASPSDKKPERVIDPMDDVRSFTQLVPTAPVPGLLPARWRSTVSAYDPSPDRLRVGYLTPGNHYTEYDAVSGPSAASAAFVADLTDNGLAGRSGDVSGRPGVLYRDAKGRESLVRTVGQVTVVVGSLRSNAPLAELTALAASLRPAA